MLSCSIEVANKANNINVGDKTFHILKSVFHILQRIETAQ